MQTPLQSILLACDIPTRSYSGRGMFGASWLAFTTDDSIGEVFAQILEKVSQGGYSVGDIAREISYLRMDSLGRGTIYYFPGVPFDSEGAQPEDID